MELLYTYGWALFALVAIIAALATFGFLDPTKLLQDRCTLPSGLTCMDFATSETSVVMIVRNDLGFDISNVTLAINGTGCAATASGPVSLKAGVKGTYNVACTPAVGRYTGTINVRYINYETNNAHRKIGDVFVTIP